MPERCQPRTLHNTCVAFLFDYITKLDVFSDHEKINAIEDAVLPSKLCLDILLYRPWELTPLHYVAFLASSTTSLKIYNNKLLDFAINKCPNLDDLEFCYSVNLVHFQKLWPKLKRLKLKTAIKSDFTLIVDYFQDLEELTIGNHDGNIESDVILHLLSRLTTLVIPSVSATDTIHQLSVKRITFPRLRKLALMPILENQSDLGDFFFTDIFPGLEVLYIRGASFGSEICKLSEIKNLKELHLTQFKDYVSDYVIPSSVFVHLGKFITVMNIETHMFDLSVAIVFCKNLHDFSITFVGKSVAKFMDQARNCQTKIRKLDIKYFMGNDMNAENDYKMLEIVLMNSPLLENVTLELAYEIEGGEGDEELNSIENDFSLDRLIRSAIFEHGFKNVSEMEFRWFLCKYDFLNELLILENPLSQISIHEEDEYLMDYISSNVEEAQQYIYQNNLDVNVKIIQLEYTWKELDYIPTPNPADMCNII